LRILSTYRQFITFLLIALYAFIITPSLFWHQHNESVYAASSEQIRNSDTPTLEAEKDAYCQICSHHYSFYSNDASFIELTKQNHFQSYFQGYAVRAFCISPLHLAERGPPARI
jgi:hypothetical protein